MWLSRIWLAFLVGTAIPSQLPLVNLGFDLRMNRQDTDRYRLAIAPLGSGRSVVCQWYSCAVVEAVGDLLKPAAGVAPFVFGSNGTDKLALAQLHGNRTVLCFRSVSPQPNGLQCLVLSYNGTSLNDGPPEFLNNAQSDFPALGQLDSDRVVACFRDEATGQNGRGRCRMITAVGNKLTFHSFETVNGVSSDHLVVASLNSYRTVVCYTSCPRNCTQRCNVVATAGNMLVSGASQAVSTGFPDSLALARIDDQRVVLCYRDSDQLGNAVCNVLTVIGTSIKVGLDQVIGHVSAFNIALVQLRAQHLFACFNSQAATATCRLFATTGAELHLLANVSSGNFHKHLAMVSVNSGKAVSCFSDLLQQGYAKCRVVTDLSDPSATSTTVTTITTSTTTTTSLKPGAPIPKVPSTCAVLGAQNDAYITDECGNVKPGELCLVKCNYDDGWSGTASRFQCPVGNTDPLQAPLPVKAWPNCKRTWKESLAIIFGVGGGVLAIMSSICIFFCPGGIKDCLRKSKGRPVNTNASTVVDPTDNDLEQSRPGIGSQCTGSLTSECRKCSHQNSTVSTSLPPGREAVEVDELGSGSMGSARRTSSDVSSTLSQAQTAMF